MSARTYETPPDVDPKTGEMKPQLPPFEEWSKFSKRKILPPNIVVSGVLHCGSKMVIGGNSKSFKTWTLMDLAVSVATGAPWWGFETYSGRVCYINLEIQPYFFRQRARAVEEAKHVAIPDEQLFVWNLRGHAADFGEMERQLIKELRDRGFTLIIIDPIYKGLGDRDENSAGEMADLLNRIEKLAVETGAAVVFGAHFAKGNASGKESIDRMSGSGVMARDPDSILTMTKHEEEDCFTVDATLRNFPPLDSFVVRREHPLMKRDETLDPATLKKPAGRTASFSVEQVLAALGEQLLTNREWRDQSDEKYKMSESTFKRLLNVAKKNGSVIKEGNKYRRQPATL